DLSDRDRHRLRWAALLHDVGKIHVDVALLDNPGPLDDAGWDVLRRHPTEGSKLLAPLWDWLGPFAPTVEQHHERWDGEGYPHRPPLPAPRSCPPRAAPRVRMRPATRGVPPLQGQDRATRRRRPRRRQEADRAARAARAHPAPAWRTTSTCRPAQRRQRPRRR